jgi:hypothetical protein
LPALGLAQRLDLRGQVGVERAQAMHDGVVFLLGRERRRRLQGRPHFALQALELGDDPLVGGEHLLGAGAQALHPRRVVAALALGLLPARHPSAPALRLAGAAGLAACRSATPTQADSRARAQYLGLGLSSAGRLSQAAITSAMAPVSPPVASAASHRLAARSWRSSVSRSRRSRRARSCCQACSRRRA